MRQRVRSQDLVSARTPKSSPLATAESSPESSPEAADREESGKAVLPDTGAILLVDDIGVNLRLAEFNAFRHLPRGWNLTTVSTPEEAISAVQTSLFDVIIMDEKFGSTELRGSEAILQLRAYEAAADRRPAVMITCTADEKITEAAATGRLPPGTDAVWSKPAPSMADGSMQRLVAELLLLRSPEIDDAAYLLQHGIEAKLRQAVAQTAAEMPPNPLEAIAELLLRSVAL